ncbi:MAG: aminomethyl-transferring glycine dehydrogenase subunit GcvPA [Coriobacteriia bacterium]|nr:aminomethyl-transferring glycine dehydrogenase subunit GcvPA [Coriobacteriia bacterium]
MRFIPVNGAQRERMLRAVGVSDAGELFDGLPAEVRLDRPLRLPPGLAEEELIAHLRELAARDLDASRVVSFLGAGCYDHYVPAIVRHVVSKPEFFTAYTPYQAEASQGTLQAVYEFQTMVAELAGMDVANASMYDGATAFAEAAYLAARATGRAKVAVSGAVHPEWVDTLRSYAGSGLLEVEIVRFDPRTGLSGADALRAAATGAAALMVASPNFFGCIEDLPAASAVAHDAGALLIAAFAPALSGVLEAPGELGADVAVAEGQPLGGPMSFGGPGLGLFACRERFLRRMPGRVVGRTVDAEGRPAFTLALQTREQHVRREKATSNICSDHSLNALAAAVHLAALGAEGLEQLGRACVGKAAYLRERLVATGRFERRFASPHGHEVALRYLGDADEMLEEMLDRGYLAGLHLRRFFPDEDGTVLLCATERRTRGEIDALAEEVASL